VAGWSWTVSSPDKLTPKEEEEPCFSLGFREGQKEVDMAAEYTQT
jgi:hypothetical protein